MKKIFFRKQFDPTDSLHKKLNILKFKDMIHLKNFFFMTKNTMKNLQKLFQPSNTAEIPPKYHIRLPANKLPLIALLNINTYGTHSVNYNSIADCNNFRKTFSESTYATVKTLLKMH